MVFAEPFPVKEIDPFQGNRTIPEDQHDAQTIGCIVDVLRNFFCRS
jgi:hypothetical protein